VAQANAEVDLNLSCIFYNLKIYYEYTIDLLKIIVLLQSTFLRMNKGLTENKKY
jgi:hypothetical protein